MAEQLWKGRFSKAVDSRVNDFNSSIRFDQRMIAQDMRGSGVHAAMLARQGIISEQDCADILSGLASIADDLSSGALTIDPAAEDVHTFVEQTLTARIGDAGKRLHTGRSRNDQVGLTFRLFVADRLKVWQQRAAHLCATLVSCADGHQDDILPGCTHMQPAQPVSLAHHLLAYAWMFRRDCMRLDDVLKRVRISPLGSAALAGTTYPLDPQSVADEVGFDGIYGNSMDAVWANPAFGFVQLSDGYSTGSSIMPQKKNPDVAELMRGKTGRVYGSLMGMLTIMKGLPMTYNRDLQEDKEGFLDADRTVDASLMLMAGMLEELTFRTDRMRAACARGFLNATELADYLVGKGLPFREAHHVTGHAVALAEKQGKGLEDLSLAELQQLDARIADDVYAVLDYAAAVRRRETPAGTGPRSVARQIEQLRSWLQERA